MVVGFLEGVVRELEGSGEPEVEVEGESSGSRQRIMQIIN